MPRKTGYKSKNALSTLVLGNPELGTSAWETEYDIEFTSAQLQAQKQKEEDRQQSQRAKLRTPRSLKKGYVLDEDYENLDERYNQTVSAYRDLQLQLGMLEQRIATMQGNESLFLRAVQDQHDLIDTLKQQVSDLTDNLGRLLGGVERNRSLMALMSSTQDAPLAQAVAANKMMEQSEVAHRVASLEAKIGDMAEAIAALARSQSLMVAARAGPQAARQPGVGNGRLGPRLSARGSLSGRMSSERIERLPKPVQLTGLGSTWKP